MSTSAQRAMMEIKFARSESVADVIMGLIHEASSSIDGALYRFNHPGLAQALEEAVHRGFASVCWWMETSTRKAAPRRNSSGAIIPFRLAFGRQGRGSKMHHKFVIVDQQTVLTGSYNWTHESEEENHENLLILRDSIAVEAYTREFEALWSGGPGGIVTPVRKQL